MHINFNSLGLEISGGNRAIFELSNGLVERGFKVTITHLGDESKYKWFPEIKAEIKNVPDTPYSLPDRAMRKVFAKYLAKYQYGNITDRERKLMNAIPDCDINVATLCWTAYSTYFSRKGKGVYLVQHFEPLFFEGRPEVQARSVSTYNLPLEKLCVSQWLTNKVNGTNIGNGINLKKFRNLNLPKEYDVMVINRKINWKGNYENIVSKLQQEGLSVAEVKSGLTEEEIVEKYNQSRLFLFLSESEGFGYPPLEAMACGTPVITTPCTEYASNNNAEIITQNTEENLINTVKGLLQDEQRMLQLQENGLRTAEHYDIQKTIDNFEKALKLSS
jgi:hypothetical protein